MQVLDPEALADAIRHASFESWRLSPRPAPSVISRLLCPRVCLDFAALGPAMLFTGMMPQHCYTLVFVTDCPSEGRSFNFATRHTTGYMGFFPPGGALDAYTPEGYANATLTVPEADFHTALERHFPNLPDSILTRGAGLRIGQAEQTQLRAVLAQAMAGIRDPAAPFATLAARRQVERELLHAFFAALRRGCGDPLPQPTQRTARRLRRLRQGRDFIAEHARQPIYLDDLCTALGLSRRGVEALFRDSLGLGPTAFLRHHRLHGVRRALREATPSPGTVKQLALEWGFWHMGNFANDYRTFFGEKPSQTLASGWHAT
jgi:AraC-like DNA-binding protein